MDKNGLENNIANAGLYIANGRKSVFLQGEEQEGRLTFEKGHALARKTFQEALTTGDVDLILLAEYLFVAQELAESEADEKEGIASAKKALERFDDAFLALEVVAQNEAYRPMDKVFPHDRDYRHNGLPRDSFHVACDSHKARLKNGLSRIGIAKLDRELAKVRLAAVSAIQEVYCGMQEQAMTAQQGASDQE
jgi:hypothetical protein